jgi:hypothetical protein
MRDRRPCLCGTNSGRHRAGRTDRGFCSRLPGDTAAVSTWPQREPELSTPPFHACPRRPTSCTPSWHANGDRTVTIRTGSLAVYGTRAGDRTANQIAGGPECGAPRVQPWRHDRSQLDAHDRHRLEGDPQRGRSPCTPSSSLVPTVPAEGRSNRALAPMTTTPTSMHTHTQRASSSADRSVSRARGRQGGRPMPQRKCQSRSPGPPGRAGRRLRARVRSRIRVVADAG